MWQNRISVSYFTCILLRPCGVDTFKILVQVFCEILHWWGIISSLLPFVAIIKHYEMIRISHMSFAVLGCFIFWTFSPIMLLFGPMVLLCVLNIQKNFRPNRIMLDHPPTAIYRGAPSETAKMPFPSSILCICGPNITAILPYMGLQGFKMVLNSYMMVSDH